MATAGSEQNGCIARWSALGGLWSVLFAFFGAALPSQENASQESASLGNASQHLTRIKKVLVELDRAFDAGDVAGFLAAFEPDHPGAHAMLEDHLRQLFPAASPTARSDNRRGASKPSAPPHYTRQSEIIGAPRAVGPRTVVRVRHQVFRDGKRVRAQLRDSIIAFRTPAGQAPVPTFLVETPRSNDCPAGNTFRCPPCNYEVGGVPGWLCVPVGRDRAQALEASSFYLAGTDLACDVSVRIDGSGRSPTQLVEGLAAALRDMEPGAEVGLATHWLPPAHADNDIVEDPPFPGLTGARIEIRLPATGDASGNVALFHVVQFGALQHLLLVRGSRTAMTNHADALQGLLASFHLIDMDAERAAAGARALLHHVGGVVKDGRYENDKHGIRMQGPKDWRVSQRCGGALLRVIWRGPRDSRLYLTGFAVPAGMDHWCEKTAEHWVKRLCDTAGIDLPARVEGWRDDAACEAQARTLRCKAARPDGAPGKADRILRVMFRKNLLVVADGTAMHDADWDAIHAALATLRL